MVVLVVPTSECPFERRTHHHARSESRSASHSATTTATTAAIVAAAVVAVLRGLLAVDDLLWVLRLMWELRLLVILHRLRVAWVELRRLRVFHIRRLCRGDACRGDASRGRHGDVDVLVLTLRLAPAAEAAEDKKRNHEEASAPSLLRHSDIILQPGDRRGSGARVRRVPASSKLCACIRL